MNRSNPMNRLALTLFAVAALSVSPVRADAPHLWLHYARSCTNPKQLAEGKKFVDLAAAHGLNGMLVGNVDDLFRQSQSARDNVRALKLYGDQKGVKIIPSLWGTSPGDMTYSTPSLHETIALKGMPFEAQGGRIVHRKSATPIRNASLKEYDLEKNVFAGWSAEHPGVGSFVEPDGGHDGKPAVRFEPARAKDKYRHSRFMQKVTLEPRRRYRFSGWFRGEDADRYFHPMRISVGVDNGKDKPMTFSSSGRNVPKGDLDWHQLSVSFTAGETGTIYLYAGSWSMTDGRFWLSDFALEEIGITELSMRKSAPRRLRNAATGVVYAEGKDWTVAPRKHGEEVVLELAKGSAIKSGDQLLFDCFIVARGGPKSNSSTCMSDPQLYAWLEKSARTIAEVLEPEVWMLGIDEIMAGGTCELCKTSKKDLAHILGECTTKMRDIIRRETPNAEIFVWSDMYDPYHNANVRLGACRGTFEGVGDLIPKDVGMMLWYGEKVDKSAPYFAERGHCLMGSICCDGKDVAGAVRKWKNGLSAYPGLRGFMYTTWINEYSKIDTFVRELK